MSLDQVYHWRDQIRSHFPELGYWQTLNMALYSLGIVLAWHSAPSRVAEKLGFMGKADCRQYLSIMMVGLAYRGCCLPLGWWCYAPDEWPDGQVALIDELLGWVADCLPDGVIPLVETDRGMGTSPELVRCVEPLGLDDLFWVQSTTTIRLHGIERGLKQWVSAPGQHWSASAVQVFKKAGWPITANAHVIWEVGYRAVWCLITNCDQTQQGWLYAQRYWQEASFRALKSAGWQWHTSRIWTPRCPPRAGYGNGLRLLPDLGDLCL